VDFAEASFSDCQLNQWMMRRKALLQKEKKEIGHGDMH
jgi:hypothetical protein